MFLSFIARLMNFKDKLFGDANKEEEKYSGVRETMEHVGKTKVLDKEQHHHSTFLEFDGVIENLCGLGKTDLKTLEPQQRTDEK